MLILLLGLCAGDSCLEAQIGSLVRAVQGLPHKNIVTQVIVNNTLHDGNRPALPGLPLSKQPLKGWPIIKTLESDLVAQLRYCVQALKAVRMRVEMIVAENKGRCTEQLHDAAQAQAAQIMVAPQPLEWLQRQRRVNFEKKTRYRIVHGKEEEGYLAPPESEAEENLIATHNREAWISSFD